MAQLPTTQLENHPAGSTGLNGIINANWERLEAIFLPIATASYDSQITWASGTKKFQVRAANAAPAYAASVEVDFTGAMLQQIGTLTGNLTLTTSNRAAGRRATVVIRADGSSRTLTFPGWTWLGAAAPASIAANKTGLLELISTGTDDASVLARWTVQP